MKLKVFSSILSSSINNFICKLKRLCSTYFVFKSSYPLILEHFLKIWLIFFRKFGSENFILLFLLFHLIIHFFLVQSYFSFHSGFLSFLITSNTGHTYINTYRDVVHQIIGREKKELVLMEIIFHHQGHKKSVIAKNCLMIFIPPPPTPPPHPKKKKI